MSQQLKINKDTKKCFVFDLDGTIIFNNQILRTNIEELLKKIMEKGHVLIFATGRPYKDFKTVMPEWTYNMPMCLFSGAVTVNNGEIIASNPIDKNIVEGIIDICHKANYPFIVDNFYKYYHPEIDGVKFGFIDAGCNKYREYKISNILKSDIYKVLILEIRALGIFEDYALKNDLAIKLHSYDDCFDLVAVYVNKYLGILPFIRNFVDHDVFVFGNDLNDYELFTHFSNSILLGDLPQLRDLAKIQINYDEHMDEKLIALINSII